MEAGSSAGKERIVLNWEEFGQGARDFADEIGEQYQPDLVVGIARGGVIVGAVIASALQVDFFPIKVSRQMMMEVVSEEPVLVIKPYSYAAGKRVLLVDDISRTGATLNIARRALEKFEPVEIKTACYADRKGDGYEPDFCKLSVETDVVFPWDYGMMDDA
jgi:hypoxanthine phosphoribosyltransferase